MKRWRLARVLKHLKAADRTSAGVDEQLTEDHKHMVTEFLFPAFIGLTKVQALQAYQAAVLALHLALGEFFAGVHAELAGKTPPMSSRSSTTVPPDARWRRQVPGRQLTLEAWGHYSARQD